MNHVRTKNILLIGCVLFATAIAWLRIVYTADRIPYFGDELLDNTLAAYNFFRSGDYTAVRFPRHFDAEITSGLFATWPAGLVWLAHGNLFVQRLVFSLLYWMEFWLLGAWFFRGSPKGKWEIAAFLSVGWLLLLRMPYWQGFMQNLAELAGALCMGFGLLFFSRGRQAFAFLFLGLAVWSCKFLYLPAACLWLVAYFASLDRHKLSNFRSYVPALAFFAPLALKLTYIGIVFGFTEAVRWPADFARFVHDGPSGISGGASLTLAQRLRTLEWKQYGFGMRAKILLLLFGPLILYPLVRLRRGASRREDAFSIATLLALLFYSRWWFFQHPLMYARHLQPALYLGFGFLVYWGLAALDWIGRESRTSLVSLGAIFALIAATLAELVGAGGYFPLLDPSGSYARRCSGELLTKECSPEIGRYIQGTEGER